MPIYKTPNLRKVVIQQQDRHNDQAVLSGVNQQLLVPGGIFYLEYLVCEAVGGCTVADGNNNQIMAGIALFNGDYSPLRCDNGIIITGTILMAKGFIMRNVL